MTNEELKNAIEYIEMYIEDFTYNCQHQKETNSAISSDDEEFKETLKILENIRDELKTHETPKKYLTYEEAMKLNPNKTYKVRLNDNIYALDIHRDCFDDKYKYFMLSYEKPIDKHHNCYVELARDFCDEKQFFNDLHLELVEE